MPDKFNTSHTLFRARITRSLDVTHDELGGRRITETRDARKSLPPAGPPAERLTGLASRWHYLRVAMTTHNLIKRFERAQEIITSTSAISDWRTTEFYGREQPRSISRPKNESTNRCCYACRELPSRGERPPSAVTGVVWVLARRRQVTS
ncbi:hypothetical protein LSAT2_012838 [Lamellibrachia satsuma]|nr:hypothetical protein LSAT2_012838 [Lamellibrachia satsuma]